MSAALAWIDRPLAGRRRRLVFIALVLSLALNLFFIAGALWIRLHQPAPGWGREHRYQRMAAELDLDAHQRAGFERYVAAMRADAARMHAQVAPLVGAAWDEVGKAQADQTQVMRLMDEAAGKRREFQRQATSETLAFLALLSPAQRGKFVAIARQDWHHHHAHP
ncbi:MAG: Spy/CpxP family protein refolding chaperone [Thiohalocapsa sp.]